MDAAAASLEAVQISNNIDAKLRRYGLDLIEALKGYKASLARARAANDEKKVAERLKEVEELEQLVALNENIIFGEGTKTLEEVKELAKIVVRLGMKDLPNEYKLYVMAATGDDVAVSFQDLESGDNSSSPLESLHAVDGATIATSLISFSNLRGKLTLTDQRRVVFVEQEEPYIRTVIFKPRTFAESMAENDGDGFKIMDDTYYDSLPDDNSKKSSCHWKTKNGREKVYAGYSLLGPVRPAGGYERLHSGMSGPEQRRALSEAVLYVESHPGEFPSMMVVDEAGLKESYEEANRGVDFVIWNLSTNKNFPTSGAKEFPNSTDGTCIAAATVSGALSSAQFREANTWLCRARACVVTGPIVDLGFFCKINFPKYNKTWTQPEREEHSIPANLMAPARFKVGQIYYNFLGGRGADGRTLLPAPATLRLPGYVRTFEQGGLVDGAGLKRLSYAEIEAVAHVCFMDAALTADGMTMMLSRMIQNEMQGA